MTGWHIYPLARTGKNRVLGAAELFDDGRVVRRADGSPSIVSASAPTAEAAMAKLRERMV